MLMPGLGPLERSYNASREQRLLVLGFGYLASGTMPAAACLEILNGERFRESVQCKLRQATCVKDPAAKSQTR